MTSSGSCIVCRAFVRAVAIYPLGYRSLASELDAAHRDREVAEPSGGQWEKRTWGRCRASHRGIHQARSPRSPSSDGTSIMRMTVASSRTARARVMPSSVGGIGPVTPKAMKTTIMMSAALVMGRPVRAIPSRTAWRASPVAS